MISDRHLFHLHSIQRSERCNKQRISILSAKGHRNGSFRYVYPVDFNHVFIVNKNLIEALEFDTCQLELSQNKGAVSKVSHQGIKTYLNARLKGGVTEYLIKSNLKLTDVIKKVKQILR